MKQAYKYKTVPFLGNVYDKEFVELLSRESSNGWKYLQVLSYIYNNAGKYWIQILFKKKSNYEK